MHHAVNENILSLYNKHICMEVHDSGIGRTEGGWKFPKLTGLSEVSSGNFQPPEVRQISDSTNLQVCLVFIPYTLLVALRDIFVDVLSTFSRPRESLGSLQNQGPITWSTFNPGVELSHVNLTGLNFVFEMLYVLGIDYRK